MALKKTSSKKMYEALDRIIPCIKEGNCQCIMPILEEYGIDLHTVETKGYQILWGITSHLDVRFPSLPFTVEMNLRITEAMRFLIEQGADVNHKTYYGDVVLHKAAMCGHADGVQLLLDYGADVDVIDSFNVTPLDEAMFETSEELSYKTRYEAVAVLLKAGANPFRQYGSSHKSGFKTPADWAASADNPTGITLTLQWQKEDAKRLREVFFNTLKEMGVDCSEYDQ